MNQSDKKDIALHEIIEDVEFELWKMERQCESDSINLPDDFRRCPWSSYCGADDFVIDVEAFVEKVDSVNLQKDFYKNLITKLKELED